MKQIVLLAVILLMSITIAEARPIDLDKDGILDNQDPYPFDYDNDGMPDEWEKANGMKFDINDAMLDYDNDGITNLQEYRNSLKKELTGSDWLRRISLESVLIGLLVIGVALIIIGIIIHIHRKRKKPAITHPQHMQRPHHQYPGHQGVQNIHHTPPYHQGNVQSNIQRRQGPFR